MKKHLTPARLLGYALCLSAVFAAVGGLSYSRFSAPVSGSGTAAVAAAALDLTSQEAIDVSDMKPGDVRTFSFQVANYSGGRVSEVAQEYEIAVETTGNLPLTYALAADGDEEAGCVKAGEGVRVWTGGLFPAAQQTAHTYILTVSWPKEKTEEDYAREIDLVTLVINAKQALPVQA